MDIHIEALVEGKKFKDACLNISSDLRNTAIEDLAEFLKPTETDWELRYSLWRQFRAALKQAKRIQQKAIYDGICSSTHWQKNIVARPEKLAFLLSQSQSDNDRVRVISRRALSECHDLLDLPLQRKDGTVDIACVKAKVELLKIVLSWAPN